MAINNKLILIGLIIAAGFYMSNFLAINPGDAPPSMWLYLNYGVGTIPSLPDDRRVFGTTVDLTGSSTVPINFFLGNPQSFYKDLRFKMLIIGEGASYSYGGSCSYNLTAGAGGCSNNNLACVNQGFDGCAPCAGLTGQGDVCYNVGGNTPKKVRLLIQGNPVAVWDVTTGVDIVETINLAPIINQACYKQIIAGEFERCEIKNFGEIIPDRASGAVILGPCGYGGSWPGRIDCEDMPLGSGPNRPSKIQIEPDKCKAADTALVKRLVADGHCDKDDTILPPEPTILDKIKEFVDWIITLLTTKY